MADDTDLREDIPESQEGLPSEGEEQAPATPAPRQPDPEERYRNLQSALAEERYRRAQQSQEIEQLKAYAGQFGALRQELDEYRKTVKQEEEDPVTELKREIRGLSERYQQDQQATQMDRQALTQRMELENQVRSQVSQFMRQKPDYPQAYQYVVQRRQADYQAMGIPPQLWGQRLENEVGGLLNETRQYGTNAAEALYNLAANWGYQPQGVRSEELGVRSNTPHPSHLTPHDSSDTGPTSLSELGGQGETPLSLRDVSKMSDADFEKAWASYEKWAKGGR